VLLAAALLGACSPWTAHRERCLCALDGVVVPNVRPLEPVRHNHFDFHAKRHHEYCEEKRVEVIYSVERDAIVTVTVYVFYGKWEEQEHADPV